MSIDKFSLRALQPSDSPALVNLITDFDGDMVTHFQVDAFTALMSGCEYQTLGVGVECAGIDGLVGVGTVRFCQVLFNGEILPLAFLDGLKVNKDFRGQGLGYRIARWRIDKAREILGDRCVIATGMLRSNDASRGVARKWCREFIDPAYQPVIRTVSTSKPKRLAGVQVRELAPDEFEQFACKQNEYYQNHNLYPLSSAQSIQHALNVSIEGKKPYRYYAAVDPQGRLLAGAQIWCRGMLKADFFSNPPLPLRIINRVAHILPPDFIIRDVEISGLWHEPGQLKTAQFFWESLRWELREQTSAISLQLDQNDPLRAVIGPKPFYIPSFEITVALLGPAPIERGKLLFGYGQV